LADNADEEDNCSMCN